MQITTVNKRVKDLTNKVFGHFTVIGFAYIKESGSAYWDCRCSCGNKKTVVGSSLTYGASTNCGCVRNKKTVQRNYKHGQAKIGFRTNEYMAWQGIKHRCYNKKDSHYYLYGGRGIIMCDRWKNSFLNFIQDMGNRPSGNYSIDRINNNGNYEPSNCMWATAKAQQNNKRTNRMILVDGNNMTITNCAIYFGVAFSTIRRMINKIGEEETIKLYTKKYK